MTRWRDGRLVGRYEERTIEQECVALEAEALKGSEYVGITNDLALRLVRAIRTRGAECDRLSSWSETAAKNADACDAALVQVNTLREALAELTDALVSHRSNRMTESLNAMARARAVLASLSAPPEMETTQ